MGEFIKGQCTQSADGTFQNTCEACPLCGPGKYLARPCSGTQLGSPDHVCQPCATCGPDTYIASCGAQQSTATYNTTAQLPPPPDANRCLPCRACDVGSYISKRCNGALTQDDRECAACVSGCPVGQYLHAKCSGRTYDADSNDCR